MLHFYQMFDNSTQTSTHSYRAAMIIILFQMEYARKNPPDCTMHNEHCPHPHTHIHTKIYRDLYTVYSVKSLTPVLSNKNSPSSRILGARASGADTIL